jgi:peptidoglycan-N-acetylglucosamine deacetylase
MPASLPTRIVRYGKRRVRGATSLVIAQFLGTITCVETSERVAALTFDDGPHPEFTPRVLDLLEQYGARGTFFVVGRSAREHPDLIHRMGEAGHVIGNHSWDHPSFPMLASRERRRQLDACEESIAPYSQRLFRPPYGNQNLRSCFDAARHKFRIVTWNVTGIDWRDDPGETVYERLAKGLRPGSILLLHDGLFMYENKRFTDRQATIDAVRFLLERFSADYRFVTVPELLTFGRPIMTWWHQPGDATYLERLGQAEASGESAVQ